MDIFEKPTPTFDFKKNIISGNTGDLRDELFRMISANEYPNLTFLFLTKRPSNINKYIPEAWKTNPPSNVMFGASVVNQKTADTLIPQLLKVNGYRFLSVEPELEQLSLMKWLPTGELHWIIQGGESGNGRRSFDTDSNEVARFCFENLKNKPDTIYIQTCQYLIPFAAPLKKKLKTRLVGMEHYPIFAQMTNLWNVDDEFRQLVLCSSQEIDSFLTVSNYLSSVMSNFGFRNKFEVIGNFISDHAIIENIKQKDFVVLYIGYQFHLKDPKTFFQAIQNIKCYDPTIKFIIVNGVDSFNDMVNYYDVADVVDMRYKLSHDEVINIMQQEASVLVSTSTAETFGMSMAEAIVCGLPVICTNSGGNLDFATKNNCLMVDKKSPVQIADFVVALKKRDYSFNALENRNVLLNQFGCDAFKSRLIVHFTN
jgi:glycosyltransferase involved in cell wall biosynthesis